MPGIHAFHPEPFRAARSTATETRAPALAQRKRALMRLAQKQGGVRIALREAGAYDRLEALAELNEAGLLQWGGLQAAGSGGGEAAYVI